MGNANEKVNISEKDIAKKEVEGARLKENENETTKVTNKDNGKLQGGKDKEGKEKEEINKDKEKKKLLEKVDPIGETNDLSKKNKKNKNDSIIKFEMSLKDKLSLKKRCKVNIPPCSRVPEPTYNIKLLINDKFEGPFQFELKINPCEIHITGFEGILLKRIKKRDIIFIQTIKNETVRMFIKNSEDQDTEHVDESNLYTSQYLGEVMQIICKFLNTKDCESFEFFFPFIYGLIVHTDKVKIPVSDFIDFGEFVIGSSKHILKRLDEYKNLNERMCDDNMSIDQENEDEILDSYEEKMIAQEREFFSRKNLELIYKSDSPFGFEFSNSSENDDDIGDEESILKDKQEKYSKFFPVSITGEAESGGIITFKDISSIGLKYTPEVIEWRISKNIGGNKAEYHEVPISVSKSFQISEDHVSLLIINLLLIYLLIIFF